MATVAGIVVFAARTIMRQQAKNSFLALGILTALISMPMTWVAVNDFEFKSGPETEPFFIGATFSGEFNAIEGKYLAIPLWITVLLICIAHVSQLMDATEFFFVPTAVKWVTAVVAVMSTATVIVHPVFRPDVSPGIGAFIGLSSAALAFALLVLPRSESDTTTGIGK